jgi:hypothetical protein
MRNRYKNPPWFDDEPPRLKALPDILRAATLTDDEVAEDNEREAHRREAVDALLKFARAEVAEARAEAARARAQATEAIARRGVNKADAQGIAEAIARHGARRANAQSITEALTRLGVEKPDAQGIVEALAGGVATADAQGIAEAMLAIALGPLSGFEDFERNPRHYAWTFLAEAWLRILTAEDPVAELKRSLGRKRGRPAADNAWRDLIITFDVQEQVDSGSSVKDACAVISADVNLSPDAVEKVYYAYRGNPGVQDKLRRRQLLDFADSSHRK